MIVTLPVPSAHMDIADIALRPTQSGDHAIDDLEGVWKAADSRNVTVAGLGRFSA